MTARTKQKPAAYLILLTSLFIILFSATQAYAQNNVTGRTWLDLDLNGAINEDEIGLGGVLVLGQDDTGLELETTTAEDGSWSLGPFNGQRVRIQFQLPQDGPLATYRSSQAGWNSVQSINLASDAEPVNAGFYDPAEFCLANPELVTTRFTAGDPVSTEGVAGNRPRDFEALFAFPYGSEGGQNSANGYAAPVPLLKNHQVGAIWGLAWDDTNKKLYTSSIVKRHAGFGPLGLGGIYVIDMSVGMSTSDFIDLAAAGVDLGTLSDRVLPVDPSKPSVDAEAFAAVGKTGIGGIDISPDGQTLYAMNLGERELIAIDIDNAEVVNQVPIPDLGCTNGVARPFAVKTTADGNVYAGAVCSAENGGSAADLSAHILQLDGDRFSILFSFPLAPFNRGDLTGGFASGEWRPWTDEWVADEAYAVPIVSDIEFDDDGSMIIAIMDRTGHQVGLQQPSPTDSAASNLFNKGAGGDIVRVCQVDGNYVLEGDFDLCPHNSLPGGRGGDEFYTGEDFEPNFETSLGGIALVPELGEVVVAVASPFSYTTSGIRWLDNTTGESRRGYQVSPGNFHFFGGANSLGDVEVICRSAPIEIGSRVWRDTNENRLFDAGEPVLPNVRIELYDVDRELSLATITSDANGRFGFSSGFGPTSDAFARSLTIQKDTNYQIRTEASQAVLDGLVVTDQDESAADFNWMLDSNARLNELHIVADFRLTADNGALSHLDIGLKLEPQVAESSEAGEVTDPLQPQSNVVGSGPGLPTQPNNQDQSGLPDELYGIPVDLSSRLFLAVASLFSGGVIAIVVGFIGLIGTFIAIRRNRRRNEQE